jgi:DDE superfamily endonuclease
MAYQNRIDPARLVFIDETWTKTNMAPLAWMGALQTTAARQGTTRALEDHDLPGRSASRSAYLSMVHGWTHRWLPPVRRGRSRATLKPGDIIDNLGSRKGKDNRPAIRTAGAKLFFLPKYSPDLNPIEKFFAKLMHWLRKAAKRTVDAVYNRHR